MTLMRSTLCVVPNCSNNQKAASGYCWWHQGQTPPFTDPPSAEGIQRLSEEAIELAIQRHRLLTWNEDGEGLTRDEIEEIKQDVVEVMTGIRLRSQ